MAEKKAQGDWNEKNRARAQKLIRLYMRELSRPEKLEGAPLNQIASALGTLVEKFGKTPEREDGPVIVTHQIPRAEEADK